MKTYTEVVATTIDGQLFPSKANIRHALADVPGLVQFTEVSTGEIWTVPALVKELAHGKTLTLIGPSPDNRKYLGTVRARGGRLTVA